METKIPSPTNFSSLCLSTSINNFVVFNSLSLIVTSFNANMLSFFESVSISISSTLTFSVLYAFLFNFSIKSSILSALTSFLSF